MSFFFFFPGAGVGTPTESKFRRFGLEQCLREGSGEEQMRDQLSMREARR